MKIFGFAGASANRAGCSSEEL